jgi:hypothetical protein
VGETVPFALVLDNFGEASLISAEARATLGVPEKAGSALSSRSDRCGGSNC